MSLIPGPTLRVDFRVGDFVLGTFSPFPSLVLPGLVAGQKDNEDRSAAAD